MLKIISFDSTYTFEPVTFQAMIDQLTQDVKDTYDTAPVL